MEVSLYTEPHLLAGTVNPTVSRRNVTLAIDNGLNLVEWRQRKEQARGQVTVYGRRLRVSTAFLRETRGFIHTGLHRLNVSYFIFTQIISCFPRSYSAAANITAFMQKKWKLPIITSQRADGVRLTESVHKDSAVYCAQRSLNWPYENTVTCQIIVINNSLITVLSFASQL